MRATFAVPFLLILMAAVPARACPMPDGAPAAVAGAIAFNNDEGVMQYCNGSDWIGMGGGGSGGGGSAAWADITGKPAGFADGTDDGITVEADPRVGTLTSDRWCRSDGAQVICDQDPAAAGTDTLADLACGSGQIAEFNGTQWICADNDSGGGGGGSIATCPAGFAAMVSAGRVLGCMQSAIEGFDDHLSASQDCFTSYGARLPTLTERYISKHPSIGVAHPNQEWLGAGVGAEGECPRLDPSNTPNSSDCDDALRYRCFIPGGSLVADPGPAGCTLDGQSLAHGQSQTFYSAEIDDDCAGISQERTCDDGELSGSSTYQYANCSAGSPYVLAGGYKWRAAGLGASCNDLCAPYGGCNLTGTRYYAGDAGNNTNCQNVLTALGLGTGAVDGEGPEVGIGCFSFMGERWRDAEANTTCSASYPGARRACACNN